MKKALLILSFALCASFAFAQPARINNVAKQDAKKAANSTYSAADVNYKASIFTKDNTVDTIKCFTFAEDDMDGVLYGPTCKLTANDILDGEPVGGNAQTQTGDYTVWHRYADTTDFKTNYPVDFPNLGAYNDGTGWGVRGIVNAMGRADEQNGFMFMGLGEDDAAAGFINAYIEFPAQENRPDAQIIDVYLHQRYVNYYDTCYIDYQIDGQWYSRAINVMGIDVQNNQAAAEYARYTMPVELAAAPTIKIRVRAYSGRRGASFGHVWALDDVAITSYGSTARMDLRNAHYMHGFYGTIPQGMNLPITWGCHIYNSGIDNLTTVSLSLAHIYNGTTTEVVNVPQAAMNAGDVNHANLALINERGWYREDEPFAGESGMYHMQHWLGHANYGIADNAGHGGHGLPTANEGINKFTVTAKTGANNGNLIRQTDTVAYYVSPEIEGTDEHEVAGYRFGFDNGLIASGSYFTPQFTDNGYVTDGNTEYQHYMTKGYYYMFRLVTGDVIPEGWVIRGIEFVPSTELTPEQVQGCVISPMVYREVYAEDGESFNYGSLNTGIEGLAFQVTEDNVNDLATGYILPGSPYKAMNIEFLDDEPLRPNTAYRVGYYMENDGVFCLSATEQYYFDEEGTGVYFDENPATAGLAYPLHFEGYWEGLVHDPEVNDDYHPCNANGEVLIDKMPMIRFIVGSPLPRPKKTLSVTCHDTRIVHASDNVCDEDISLAVGSSQSIGIYGGDDHMVIDSIYFDGQKVEPYNEDTEEGDENLVSYEDNVLGDDDVFIRLARERYSYYIPDVQDDHTIEAWAHYEEWNVGIDPVAPEVNMTLVPNPATSQVKVNIAGVTGMVNMNIIDMSGRVIYNANVNAENETIVNLSNIPAGAYFVRITNDTFSKVEKLIVR